MVVDKVCVDYECCKNLVKSGVIFVEELVYVCDVLVVVESGLINV